MRKAKTDKIDAVKLANMAIERWLCLKEYTPEDEIRQTLKICSRQYDHYNKIKTMLKNNLIALLDQIFPGVNKLFTSPARKSDGHEKWVDFALKFWHCKCVSRISERQFKEKYEPVYEFLNKKCSEGKPYEYSQVCIYYTISSLICQAIFDILTA